MRHLYKRSPHSRPAPSMVEIRRAILEAEGAEPDSEANVRLLSKLCEFFNATNPDMPPLPVARLSKSRA